MLSSIRKSEVRLIFVFLLFSTIHTYGQFYPKSILDKINFKSCDYSNIPEDLFDFKTQYTEKEIEKLKLNIDSIPKNEYFKLSLDTFFSEEYKYKSQLYYKSIEGLCIQKVLRIFFEDSRFIDVVLAQKPGDIEVFSVSTTFINDSLLKKTMVRKETVKDDTYHVEILVDSIIETYKYDNQLTLYKLNANTFQYLQGTLYKKDNTFLLNDQKVYWKFNYVSSDLIKSDEMRQIWLTAQELKEESTDSILLDLDLNNFSNLSQESLDTENINEMVQFTINDYNFDGWFDVLFITDLMARNMGYILYKFDHNRNRFYESGEIYSACDIELDSSRKTLSYCNQGGGGIVYYQKLYYANDKLGVLERFWNEFYVSDTIIDNRHYNLYKYHYQKKSLREEKILNAQTEIMKFDLQTSMEELSNSFTEWMRKFEPK